MADRASPANRGSNGEYVLGSLTEDSEEESSLRDSCSFMSESESDHKRYVEQALLLINGIRKDVEDVEKKIKVAGNVKSSKTKNTTKADGLDRGSDRPPPGSTTNALVENNTSCVLDPSLDEYLLQTILKLDNIDTRNDDVIRDARKGAIVYTQNVLDYLDAKKMMLSKSQVFSSGRKKS